jgi:cationic amino acid transporter 4
LTDILAVCIVAGVSLLLRFGVRTTSYLNNVLSLVNVAVIALLLVFGGFQANLDNWRLPGRGFLPFGWQGVFAASGSCFYAFVGFESVAASGEEAKNPQKSIPLATLASMAFATTAYVSVSAVLTLMQPYDQLSGESGLPDAIGRLAGGVWAKWAVVLGACCGMGSVLIGTLYALTRIMYAMSDDALLPRSLGQLHENAQVPLRPMYICAAFAALLAAIFPLTTLVETMSIGTLLAYTLVSASVIILRYRPSSDSAQTTARSLVAEEALPGDNASDHFATPTTNKCVLVWNDLRDRLKCLQRSSPAPRGLVASCVCLIIILQFQLCWFGPFWYHAASTNVVYRVLLLLCVAALFACVIAIAVQPQTNYPSRYRVPLVPLVPALSIVFNVTLMANLSYLTWTRLIVWMQAGLVVYLLYTVRLAPNPSEFWRVNCSSRNWGSLDSPPQTLEETDQEETNPKPLPK